MSVSKREGTGGTFAFRVLSPKPIPDPRSPAATKEFMHGYWKMPLDEKNFPERYLGQTQQEQQRSQKLVELMKTLVEPGQALLEIGCNVGRNLEYLRRAGYAHLHGIELNEQVIPLMQQHFPELAAVAHIRISAIEDVIRTLPANSFDVVYTVACLEHLAVESEWVFAEIARVARRYVICVEDEGTKGLKRLVPRNYESIFCQCHYRQIYERQANRSPDGLTERYWWRVFEKIG